MSSNIEQLIHLEAKLARQKAQYKKIEGSKENHPSMPSIKSRLATREEWIAKTTQALQEVQAALAGEIEAEGRAALLGKMWKKIQQEEHEALEACNTAETRWLWVVKRKNRIKREWFKEDQAEIDQEEEQDD